MCLLAPFILLALTCVGLALILAIVGLVRRSADAGLAANWFGLAAMLPLTLLLSLEFGDRYGPSFLGWCHLLLFALAVLSILLGTLRLSAGSGRRRRWRNTVVALAVLWLFVAVFFVVQYINGTRREREFYRPTPDRAQSAIEITVRRCGVPDSSSSRIRLMGVASSGTVLVTAEERSMAPRRASSRRSTSSSRV
jgi:hypothetical protein